MFRKVRRKSEHPPTSSCFHPGAEGAGDALLHCTTHHWPSAAAAPVSNASGTYHDVLQQNVKKRRFDLNPNAIPCI
ncbi:MAG: hypothetical protein H0X25_18455 [Acidobacteriales bacterium]|nr:hypothetical protein [Terriglobales bacterium]